MYYDIRKALSYNCLFNFIVGNRGCGKSYSAKDFVLSKWLKTKKEFIYLRRFDTELKQARRFYMGDIKVKYPNIIIKDGLLKYDEKDSEFDGLTVGYFYSLSKASNLKSVSFPNVDTIIFDEFILDSPVHHYLKDELRVFFNFYETVARLRDVRVLFLGNSFSLVNPYFSFFNITELKSGQIIHNNDVLIEMIDNPEYSNTKKQTRFGKIIEGSIYSDYMVDNMFINDSNSFIRKKKGNCKYLFGIIYNSEKYGVWQNLDDFCLFISHDYMKSKMEVAYSYNDHIEGAMYKDGVSGEFYTNVLRQNFSRGRVFFEDVSIKSMFSKIINVR